MNRGNGVAIWRQIQQTLEEDIARGVYKPGERLPNEADLAERFKVNRHTLRRAVGALQESGAVRIEQGRGTYVQEAMVDYAVGRRTRFTENILRMQRHPGGHTLRSLSLPADSEVAGGLSLSAGDRVFLIERVGVVDERPVSIATHYFPQARFPGMLEEYEKTDSITRALAAQGVDDYFRKTSRIGAAMPGSDDARHLQQPHNQPVLTVESVNVDAQGEPIEYSLSRFSALRVNLLVEL